MSNSRKNNETKKETLNLKNLNDEQLISLDIENLNNKQLIELLNNNNSIKPQLKTNKKVDNMFKYPSNILDDKTKLKSFRIKARRRRNNFIDNILFAYQNEQKEDLNNLIKDFNKFYKETYFLNDYSLESICRLNSDKNTIAKTKIFLKIVKDAK